MVTVPTITVMATVTVTVTVAVMAAVAVALTVTTAVTIAKSGAAEWEGALWELNLDCLPEHCIFDALALYTEWALQRGAPQHVGVEPCTTRWEDFGTLGLAVMFSREKLWFMCPTPLL